MEQEIKPVMTIVIERSDWKLCLDYPNANYFYLHDTEGGVVDASSTKLPELIAVLQKANSIANPEDTDGR